MYRFFVSWCCRSLSLAEHTRRSSCVLNVDMKRTRKKCAHSKQMRYNIFLFLLMFTTFNRLLKSYAKWINYSNVSYRFSRTDPQIKINKRKWQRTVRYTSVADTYGCCLIISMYSCAGPFKCHTKSLVDVWDFFTFLFYFSPSRVLGVQFSIFSVFWQTEFNPRNAMLVHFRYSLWRVCVHVWDCMSLVCRARHNQTFVAS